MIEDRDAIGKGLGTEVRVRIAAQLADIPEQQQGYALEIITCQLDLFDAVLGDGLTGRHRATIRMLGHEWAARRWPLDPLLALLGKVAEETTAVLLSRQASETMADALATVADVSHQCLAELSNGFKEISKPRQHREDPQQAALALLRGDQPPEGWRQQVAAAYGVLAFRIAEEDLEGHERAEAWLAAQVLDGTLSLVCDQGGYALIPAHDITFAIRFAQQLQAKLPEESWTAVSWRVTAEIPAGRAEAADVLTSALASQRSPGCYELGDVLVEYAILRHPKVRELLVKRIEPVVHNPLLLETLDALRAANGNRTKAAASLIIHRSTLDYRLGQIERLTGHQPSSSRSLQVLSAGLTAHAASHCTLPDVSDWDR
ncbi:PucR family transcriptional regulator [Amycolatopsis sp. NPDC059657]|uniref:PucR family transcriptional regulator n=1 Tax=Amycolatopsis sp. NPDC059657 TaxID=3346899 RepID=UPI00366AF2DC